MTVPARHVELHCHLDACVRPATITDLARTQGITLAGPPEVLAVAPPSCAGLTEYIAAIDIALDVMQTPEALARVARELVEDWHADGVVHGEVRWAPQLHTRRGVTMAEALEAVEHGLAEGRAATGVSTATILCCLRHQPREVAERVVGLAVDRRDRVAGVDLAGPEAGNPGAHLADVYATARAARLGVTIHAGEAAGPEMVWEALEVLGAQRIGHGVRSIQDPALVARLAVDGITLETCPTSNVQTGAVARLADHPADRLLRAGCAVTVSTDGRTVSATTMAREYARMAAGFGWGAAEHAACTAAAVRGAFVGEDARRALSAAVA